MTGLLLYLIIGMCLCLIPLMFSQLMRNDLQRDSWLKSSCTIVGLTVFWPIILCLYFRERMKNKK